MSENAMNPPRGLLHGRVALITGGASGIGRATAMLFGREGAAVAVMDLDKAGGQAVAQETIDKGGRAVFIHGNVALASDCERAVQRTYDEMGGLSILFNNAGIVRRATVLELSEEDWDRVMAVNVKSMFLLSKYAVPVMIKAGGGAIINMSSGWGLVGGPRAVAYCASKGAVIQLTKAMALDHGEHNIRVNAICPGDTDTPMLSSEARQVGESDEHFRTSAANRPLKRIGLPAEIAQAALFLASDASSFVTGTTLVVDGGGIAG
jgi:NAD(P)-dependent dehydrogenase (short-subunit alcohol dehydrogenase family)